MSPANLRAIQAIKEKDEAEKREEQRRVTPQPSSSTLVQQQRALVAQVQALNTKKRQLEEAERESAKRVSSQEITLALCGQCITRFHLL